MRGLNVVFLTALEGRCDEIDEKGRRKEGKAGGCSFL